MGRLDNVTAESAVAARMKGAGRFGDSEMAHVTKGEIVVPLSAQTPKMKQTMREEFQKQGLPLSRYTVEGADEEGNGDTIDPRQLMDDEDTAGPTAPGRLDRTSINPVTGKPEYFSIKKAVKGVAKAAVAGAKGYAMSGGNWAAAAAAAGKSALKSAQGGNAGSDGSSAAGGGVTPTGEIVSPPIASTVGAGRLTGLSTDMDVAPLETASPVTENTAAVIGAPMQSRLLATSPSVNPITGAVEFFDSAAYLQRYPDVAAAVKKGAKNGGFDSAQQHYDLVGKKEGRTDIASAKAATPTATPASVSATVSANTAGKNDMLAGNANTYVSRLVNAGKMTSAEYQAFLKGAGYSGATGAGQVEDYFANNTAANHAAINQLADKYGTGNGFVDHRADDDNAFTSVLDAYNKGTLSGAGLTDVIKGSGFQGTTGNGSVYTYAATPSGASRLQTAGASRGIAMKTPAAAPAVATPAVTTPTPVAENAATFSPLTPTRSQRFRGRGINVGTDARNF